MLQHLVGENSAINIEKSPPTEEQLNEQGSVLGSMFGDNSVSGEQEPEKDTPDSTASETVPVSNMFDDPSEQSTEQKEDEPSSSEIPEIQPY